MALALPVSPRTKVFRAIVAVLKADPVLSNAIKPDAFRSWAGVSLDNQEFSFSMAPAIRLTPTNGPEGFLFPDAQVGDLYINVEMLVSGTNVDDQQNLWWAIERAIYPADYTAKTTIIQNLQNAGANTGLCFFSQPAFDPEPKDRFFAATGQIKIAVRLQLNT